MVDHLAWVVRCDGVLVMGETCTHCPDGTLARNTLYAHKDLQFPEDIYASIVDFCVRIPFGEPVMPRPPGTVGPVPAWEPFWEPALDDTLELQDMSDPEFEARLNELFDE